MIPEKRAPRGGRRRGRWRRSGSRDCAATFFGDGPERDGVLARDRRARRCGAIVGAPGFVAAERGRRGAAQRALCMLLPSRREGYGMVVVEAAARGTPSIVVAGEDNAATELIEEGVNGTVAAERRRREAIADAIVRVHEAGLGAAREHRARGSPRTRSGCRSSPRCETVLDEPTAARRARRA